MDRRRANDPRKEIGMQVGSSGRVVRIRMMWAGGFIGKSSKNPDDVGRSVHREE